MTDVTPSGHYRDDHMASSSPRPAAVRTGDDTRQALLAAAHDLLATEGAGALTVRRIATAAGMSTMNVYSRFGGKDGVLDELFTDGFRRLSDHMSATPQTDDPMADLRTCGAAYRQFARENPTYYSLMFDRVAPDFLPSEIARENALKTLGQLARRVQRAMDAGALMPGDAFQVATGLWACEHGLVSLEAHASDDHVAFDWETVAPMTVDALLRGLSAPA